MTKQQFCFIPMKCQLSEEESLAGTVIFAEKLKNHGMEIRSRKMPEEKQTFFSSVTLLKKPIKKVVILDAGGVLQPDAEFGASNQVLLSKLTNLSENELNHGQDYHAINKGELSLHDALKNLAKMARTEN